MTKQNRGKLNQLERLLPDGLLVDAGWLSSHGYSTSLRRQYVTSGWLEHPTGQVYQRPGGRFSWQQAIVSLQMLLGCDLVAGGRTALELKGFSHYLKRGEMRDVHLYGPKHPPKWLGALPLEIEFVYHNNRKLFRDPAGIVNSGLAESFTPEFIVPRGHWAGELESEPWERGYSLIVSSPERAVLELLDELPDRESFHEADMLLEGMSNLSPRRMEKLLLDCRSIKVKRLFFFFADRHNHAWLKKINKRAIDLGKGKRLLARGGVLDPVYQITIPEELRAVR